MNDPLPLAQRRIVPATSLAEAGAIWLARLETAGLDTDESDEADLDEAERAEREEQRHHSRQTINTYRTAITLFTRWLERHQRTTVGTLQLDDLVHYVRALRKRDYDLSVRAARSREAGETGSRLAPRTVYTYTRPLFGFFALLESFDAIGFRTAAVRLEVSRMLPRLPEPFAPTPPDLRRIASFYDRPTEQEDRTGRLRLIRLRNAALLHILFSSGARISEVLGLQVGDVYRDRRVLSRVTVYSKGRREGVIFLRRSAERALHTYLAARDYPPPRPPCLSRWIGAQRACA